MNLSEPITDIIKKRSSRRTYVPEPLDPKLADALHSHLQAERTGPFNLKARFALISGDTHGASKPEKIGTYGMISGASQFIIGAVRLQDKSLENFGYLMEETILYATSLGLGTCWLGGSLKRKELQNKIALQADEYIPAMTPVGKFLAQPSLQETLVSLSAGAKQRKPWSDLFFHGDFSHPLTESQAGFYAEALEMVRLGPSASNRQPWRIVKEWDQSRFHFYLQKNPVYSQIARLVLAAREIQKLDMGIAMCHFEKTAQESGHGGFWYEEQSAILDVKPHRQYIVSWKEAD